MQRETERCEVQGPTLREREGESERERERERESRAKKVNQGYQTEQRFSKDKPAKKSFELYCQEVASCLQTPIFNLLGRALSFSQRLESKATSSGRERALVEQLCAATTESYSIRAPQYPQKASLRSCIPSASCRWQRRKTLQMPDMWKIVKDLMRQTVAVLWSPGAAISRIQILLVLPSGHECGKAFDGQSEMMHDAQASLAGPFSSSWL